MVIQWYGQGFIRIDTRDIVISIDPFLKKEEVGIVKTPRFQTDVVLISRNRADLVGAEAFGGSPIIFEGPGEYEIKAIFVQGHALYYDQLAKAAERGSSTIFTLDVEDVRVCYIGDIGVKKIPAALVDKIGEADVLFIPIGGAHTFDAKNAWGLIAEIEPKVVVPIYYKIPGLKVSLNGIEEFLKEKGEKSPPLDRLAIRKRDIPEKGVSVQVLKPLAFVG